LKSTGPRGPWGFESLALRHFSRQLRAPGALLLRRAPWPAASTLVTNSSSGRTPTHAFRPLTPVVGVSSAWWRTARYGSTATLMTSVATWGLSMASRADSDSLVLRFAAVSVAHLKRVIDALERQGMPTCRGARSTACREPRQTRAPAKPLTSAGSHPRRR
jgi:hypothetical protein